MSSVFADTYVLLVDELSDDVQLSGTNLIRISAVAEVPEYLTIDMEQEIGGRVWKVVPRGDQYDSLRNEIAAQVYLAPEDPEDPVNDGSVTFEIITQRASYSRSTGDLRFPDAIVAVTDTSSVWERLYIPPPKDTQRSDGKATLSKSISDTTPSVDDFVDVEQEPEFEIKRIASLVVYPDAARFRNLEGQVLVAGLVGSDGAIQNVKIIETVDSFLNSYAAAAVLLTEFKPAIKNGEPVPLWVRIPIMFKLR